MFQRRLLSKGCRLGNLTLPLMLSALSSLGRASEVFMRGADHSYCKICHLMQSNFAYMSSFKLVIKQWCTSSIPVLLNVQSFIGAVTGGITTPLDVIKTRLMVQGSTNQYKGIFDCVQNITREEGPAALLKGIGLRVFWIGIGGSIFFGVLERTKRLLAQSRPMSQHSNQN